MTYLVFPGHGCKVILKPPVFSHGHLTGASHLCQLLIGAVQLAPQTGSLMVIAGDIVCKTPWRKKSRKMNQAVPNSILVLIRRCGMETEKTYSISFYLASNLPQRLRLFSCCIYRWLYNKPDWLLTSPTIVPMFALSLTSVGTMFANFGVIACWLMAKQWLVNSSTTDSVWRWR